MPLVEEIINDYQAALANQYQRIERFVELVDRLERKLQEATEANTSCTIYIASQMDRITELEQEQITLWHTINTQATYAEELEAQLAAAQEWQPLEDGLVYHYTESIGHEWNYPAHVESVEFLEVRDNGNIIACGSMPKEDEHEASLPDNIRLCRVVTQEPTL